MAAKEKKELSKKDIQEFVKGYASKNEITQDEARDRIMATGVSRLTTLGKYQKSQGGGGKKRAAKKGAAKKASKKAAPKKAKKAPKKRAAKKAAPERVSEGEEG